VPPTAQRFWTTAVPLAAATAAPEAGSAPTPSKRRFKYNHDEIFESAERLFDTTLGADHAEVAAPDVNGAITAEMIDEFKATIDIIDRKRARRPVKRTGEVRMGSSSRAASRNIISHVFFPFLPLYRL
jgi:hypothetical protein